MKQILFFLFIILSILSIAQPKEGYKYTNNKTYTYDEAIAVYQVLSVKYPQAKLKNMGTSDVGKPIYLFTISKDKDFNPASNKKKGKTVLLINNAIHPGEPCGVDASIKFANDLLSSKYDDLLENTVVCIIPFYNVGGGLNRSNGGRAGQNGPEEYGFRGNAQNRDLNRDFIKCDTKNSIAFTNIYSTWRPDVFIDAHTTNGSDFQYTMSLLTTQPDKLNLHLRNYLRNEMLPELYSSMKIQEKEIIPYVHLYGKTPKDGIKDYLDSPRYSTGYTALFNTIGFVTEALKYKTYQARVEHTYAFLMTTLKYMSKNNAKLKEARTKAIEMVKTQKEFELDWHLDTTSFSQIDFKGYETEMVLSTFGAAEKRLVYNHNKPYTEKINYYLKYTSSYIVEKPTAYIIPQAYKGVINRLKWNRIKMKQIQNDTTIEVEMYYIKDYRTVKQPYEGHYLHYGVETETKVMDIKFHKGDYLVYVNQAGNRYVVETLEPKGKDSFFAWNFFDGILQQKEWFSSFSFENIAEKLLKENKELNTKFEQKKKDDVEFANSRKQQLYYIYKNSPYYENTHNRYPIGRLIE